MSDKTIAGYSYGTNAVSRSPITMADLELLKRTVLLAEEDAKYLRMAGEVLADQLDEVLDLWYGFVGSHPHLLYYFTGPHGQPNTQYLDAVRKPL